MTRSENVGSHVTPHAWAPSLEVRRPEDAAAEEVEAMVGTSRLAGRDAAGLLVERPAVHFRFSKDSVCFPDSEGESRS